MCSNRWFFRSFLSQHFRDLCFCFRVPYVVQHHFRKLLRTKLIHRNRKMFTKASKPRTRSSFLVLQTDMERDLQSEGPHGSYGKDQTRHNWVVTTIMLSNFKNIWGGSLSEAARAFADLSRFFRGSSGRFFWKRDGYSFKNKRLQVEPSKLCEQSALSFKSIQKTSHMNVYTTHSCHI